VEELPIVPVKEKLFAIEVDESLKAAKAKELADEEIKNTV